MLYSRKTLPLSLLIGIGSFPVSMAAATPCSQDSLLYTEHEKLCDRSTQAAARDTSTGPLDLSSTGSNGLIHDILGSANPVIVTTTEDLTRGTLTNETSVGLNRTDHIWASSQPGEQLDTLRRSGILEGYLGIFSASEKGSMTVKLASLGYSENVTGNIPFELWTETQLGSLVILDPTESVGALEASPSPEVSNKTMTFFDPRSVHLSMFARYNATTVDSVSPASTVTSITVRLRADISTVGTAAPMTLCATYDDNYNQLQDYPPVRLERCDNAGASGSHGASETQLWRYVLVTGEIRPLLSAMTATSDGQTKFAPQFAPSATNTANLNDTIVVETAAPVPAAAFVSTISPERAETSMVTRATPISSAVSSYTMASRDEANAQKLRPKIPKAPIPGSTIRKQDAVGRHFAVGSFVNPYNLVFTPKAAIKTTTKAPQTPL